LGQLHSNLDEIKNVSINWKNLGRSKLQQTSSTLAKRQ